MHLEYPVREEHARLFLNRPVGVVLMDGTRHFGVVTGCEKGKLILNGGVETTKPKRKGAGKRKVAGKRASSSAAPFAPAVPYGPYNPYTPVVPPAPRVALDLATIALLFALLR